MEKKQLSDKIDVYTYVYTHTTHTQHNNKTKGNTNIVYYDKDVWKSLQSIASELGTDVSHLLWPLIQKIVELHDGRKNGLEKFIDPNFIKKPDIDDDFGKVLSYLRTLNDESLDKILRTFYQGYIHIKALQDTPPDQRRTVEFVYDSIWRKYR